MGNEQYQVKVDRNLLIPLRDGATLAADLYRPDADGPFPALLSFYPYHKDDLIGAANEFPRRYFAACGYAVLLIDFRGLGSSDGIVHEAMDRGEGRDGAEAVEWIASQSWCDGNVGMFGMSYGGISSLKVAFEQPPHLKAIAPIMGTNDIYLDYIYSGGCLSCLPAFGAWGSFMLAMNLMPPTLVDPAGRWYRVWQQRLEHALPYIFPWQDHSSHDEYWQPRAVDCSQIKIPAFVIGGWRDIFPEAMTRVYEQLGSANKKLLMGPWMHTLPDLSPHEPVDYLPEMSRFFDRWLKNQDNGIDREPPVTYFVQGSANRWRSERKWPIPRTTFSNYYLGPKQSLGTDPAGDETSERYQARPSVGTHAGLWDPTALGIGLPLDQNHDDLASVAFTSAALQSDLEISGSLEALIKIAVESGDDVNLVVKLCDVAPDGSSSLISTGWLKAAYRNSLEIPEPVPTGQIIDMRVAMVATSYMVARRHRLRVSISCSDFPRIFPTRTNPVIRVYAGGRRGSHVRIPVAPPPKENNHHIQVSRPDTTINRSPLAVAMTPRWTIERDLAAGRTSVITGSHQVSNMINGGSFEMDHTARASVTDAHPEGAAVEANTTIALRLPSIGKVVVKTTSWIGQDGMSLTGQIEIEGNVVFEQRWRK
ncbi:MAG: CocE/NonD family hydrolase [Candidatus Binataceae bacterium]